MIEDNTHEDINLIKYPELGKRTKPDDEYLFESAQGDIADLGPIRDVLGSAVTCKDKGVDKQVLMQTTAPTAATFEGTIKDSCVEVPGAKVRMPYSSLNLTFGWQRKRDWKALVGKTGNRGKRKYCDYPSWLEPAQFNP